jgi:hypothetical protein
MEQGIKDLERRLPLQAGIQYLCLDNNSELWPQTVFMAIKDSCRFMQNSLITKRLKVSLSNSNNLGADINGLSPNLCKSIPAYKGQTSFD